MGNRNTTNRVRIHGVLCNGVLYLMKTMKCFPNRRMKNEMDIVIHWDYC
jgi:hypothetical protein